MHLKLNMEIKQILPKEALEAINNGSLLVDVRENHEVEEAAYDVVNCIHIPLGELQARLNEIPKDKDLIMACRSGARSMRAAQFLAEEGYNSLNNLQSGIIGWVESGLATK